MIADWVRRFTQWRLPPYSWKAFAFAIGCVAAATGAALCGRADPAGSASFRLLFSGHSGRGPDRGHAGGLALDPAVGGARGLAVRAGGARLDARYRQLCVLRVCPAF